MNIYFHMLSLLINPLFLLLLPYILIFFFPHCDPDLYDSSSVPSSLSPSFHSNPIVELDITTEIHISANLDPIVDTTADNDLITIPKNTIQYFSPSPIPPPFDPPILRKSTRPYHPPA